MANFKQSYPQRYPQGFTVPTAVTGPLYPLTGPETANALSIATAPTHLYRATGEASLNDLIGTANFTTAGTEDAFQHDQLGLCARQGITQRGYQSNAGSNLSPGTEDWAYVCVEDNPAHTGSDLHHINCTVGATLNSRMRTSDHVSQLGDGSVTVTQAGGLGGGAVPTGVNIMALVIDRTANTFVFLDTTGRSVSSDISSLGSVDFVTMGMGTNAVLQPTRYFSWAAIWQGAGAADITMESLNSLKEFIGTLD